MKNIFLLFVFLLSGIASIQAQKVYYIYLQTDNQQPFYARMGERIYNSNSAGYLILSNLKDSTYSINIGIQGSQTADQPYSIPVNRKDQGFIVKNFADKGWGLFNLTTMAVIMPTTNPISPIQAVKTEKRDDNAFMNLLAKAADDSTIKEKPILEKPVGKPVEPVVALTEKKDEPKAIIKDEPASNNKQEDIKKETITVEKKEEPKVDSAASLKQIEDDKRLVLIKADSFMAAKNHEAEILKQEEIRKEEVRKQDSVDKAKASINENVDYKRSTVRLKSESSTTTGIGLVFLDMLNDNTDTIRILIPPDFKKTAPAEVKQEEKKFLDISSNDSLKIDEAKPLPARNNNCKSVANDDDFFKVRKKMVGESNDNNMVAEASKAFKTKCFSTVQLKNLSTLFLTDEYKYKFFDAAYEYVSDAENFASLQSELKDDYYINRFKAMLRF